MEYRAPLKPDEVEVKAEAWPVSFRDIFIPLGRLGREELGVECAGTVTRVGSACTSLHPGDRVVMAIPGFALINPGTTAYHALVNVAGLQAGEKILIHSAAGSTGQFAVGVAKMLGAEVFATFGYDDKKQLLMDRFGVKRVTNGYGVDVVLNSLSGDGLRASWECITSFGRFVEIGKADIGANTPLPMGSFAAVDLIHITLANPRLLRRLTGKVLELATSPEFLGRKGISIHAKRQKHESYYRQLEGTDIVPKFITRRCTWQFDENASYLVAGGLGGLGRPLIRWMAEKGVRVLTPRCDVSSASGLATMLNDLTSATGTVPPIKGCIHAAMKMSYPQWSRTIQSKVSTSWNLHELLPDLDFFIMLASIVGIYGSPGQGTYAAGCAF
ncbi:hypothetical protein PFICI_08881 [Pestalotiopsis fici W106-1]|uniref:Uncharacterized protein n=1 Tax=Pestalotiopsis fici (strain W106-1 / CGMCC3.15140) TaxID=1229662 RepID=W3WYS6_PESFW|nr:uncharacterized protein PFICI_08881 [Pestalotiopsis fici W106-1]ETS79028.1 hypothetical protein PFICI_08881 [Pestalotiopsis fici W106-1]